MNPNLKGLGKFYMTLTAHLPYEPMTAPSPRPFISEYGSIPENIGVYVEHHLKHIATKHSIYIQDTPDILINIDQINKGQPSLKNAMLVTMVAIGAYTNIPQEDGVKCIREALEKIKNYQTFWPKWWS